MGLTEGGLAGLFGTLWPYLRALQIVNCNSKIIRSEDLLFVSCAELRAKE